MLPFDIVNPMKISTFWNKCVGSKFGPIWTPNLPLIRKVFKSLLQNVGVVH
jgi:hypothetical protein